MTISRHIYTATLTGLGTVLPIKSGTVTLDETWSPYVQADLIIPIPALAVLAALDPRINPRIVITAAVVYGETGAAWNTVAPLPTSRTFDLILTSRSVDHAAGTVSITLASDEAILQDYALVASTPRLQPTSSALTAIRDALALAANGATFTLASTLAKTTKLTRTNLCQNPSFEANLSGWTSNQATASQVAAPAGFGGAGSIAARVVPNATTNDSFISWIGGGMTPGLVAGRTYTVSCNYLMDLVIASGATTRARRIVLFTRVGAGAYVEQMSTQATPGQVTRLSMTFTIPTGSTDAFIRFYHGGTNLAPIPTMTLDSVLLEETDEVRPYFDGSFTNRPETSYAWSNPGGASASTVIELASVGFEATAWEPGVTAWDYLQSLLATSGLRLFCDESRVWRLVDATYTVPGSVRIAQGWNLIDGTDLISRTNTGDWFNAVVIRYAWTDEYDLARTAYDIASAPGFTKVRTIDINAPYPGPGAAKYLLARSQGRGRILDLSTVSDYASRPGMEILATLPNTPITSGYIVAVTWDFNTDEMTVTSRGLVETSDTAWILSPAGIAWSSIVTGVKWNTYTN